VTGQSGDLLKNSAKERETLNSRLQEIRANLDVATRKLTVWYGRQKRLQSTDPVNLATEVSVSSEQVKEKKEIFERATWAYLQESETLRYNPTDTAQQAKVDNLAKQRKQRMNDLAAEVREAIDHEITESNRVISDLTLERDTIQRKLDVINKDVEYVQTLLGSDARSKEALKNELLRQKKVAESELEELKQLLPDQKVSTNQASSVQ
jgi:chromosome segregation ATPase